MVSLKWLNEKGNVSVKVRDGVRAQVKNKLLEGLNEVFDDVSANANGGYSVAVGVDERSGATIYAHFDMTVNLKTPADKNERKKAVKKAETTSEPVPNLFD